MTQDVFGYSIPEKYYKNIYMGYNGNYAYWTNLDQQISSPSSDIPGMIYSNGSADFYKDGVIHRANGPARIIKTANGAEGIEEYWLFGKKVSKGEFSLYDPFLRRITYHNKNKGFHRLDGPALIQFTPPNKYKESYYINGKLYKTKKDFDEARISLNYSNFDFKDGNGKVPAYQHLNGRGWVAETAYVADSAYVGKNALVYGNAKVFNKVKIYGSAHISGDAIIQDNSQVYGESIVCGTTFIGGNSNISGYSVIDGSTKIIDNVPVNLSNSSFIDKVFVGSYDKNEIKLNSFYKTFEGEARSMKDKNQATIKDLTTNTYDTIFNNSNVIFKTKANSMEDNTVNEASRIDNLIDGGKLGLKKGMVDVSSEALSKKLLSLSKVEDSYWLEKLGQILLILLSAEVLSVSTKNAKSQVEFLRILGGEHIGREATNIVSNLAESFVDIINLFSAEEIIDLSNDFEESPALEEFAEMINSVEENKQEVLEYVDRK